MPYVNDNSPSTPSTQSAIQLPVINISSPDRQSTANKLLDAAVKYGFLYIDTKGTGFTEEVVNDIFQLSKDFFASPLEEKQPCTIDTNNRGWTGMHNEILDPKTQVRGDFKEAFNIGEFTDAPSSRSAESNNSESKSTNLAKPSQLLPKAFQGNESQIYRFETLCRETCKTVLDLLAFGLEVEEEKFFSKRHTKPSGCTLRLLHYPALQDGVDFQEGVDIRAGAHSDYGSCTLLFQRLGQPGLEIRTPSNEWAPVPVLPEGYDSNFPPILINIGDLLSYWTNGLLKSTVHRVIFPLDSKRGEDRYSIAFFCHPANDTELVAVPSARVKERDEIEEGQEVGYGGGAATKRAMTAKEHLMNRLEATYGFRMETGTVKT